MKRGRSCVSSDSGSDQRVDAEGILMIEHADELLQLMELTSGNVPL